MTHPLRHDKGVAFAEFHHAGLQLDPEAAFHDNEELVFCIVSVPGQTAFDLGHFPYESSSSVTARGDQNPVSDSATDFSETTCWIGASWVSVCDGDRTQPPTA